MTFTSPFKSYKKNPDLRCKGIHSRWYAKEPITLKEADILLKSEVVSTACVYIVEHNTREEVYVGKYKLKLFLNQSIINTHLLVLFYN